MQLNMSLSEFSKLTGKPVVAIHAIATYPDGTRDERTISGQNALKALLAWTVFRADKGAQIKTTPILKGERKKPCSTK